jgi:hypothetical protein
MIDAKLLAVLGILGHVFGKYARKLHRAFLGRRASTRKRLACDTPDLRHNVFGKEFCKISP